MIKYDENSIVTLNWREGIRQNLGMYIGDADENGLLHLMIEAVANSIDESAAGYGTEIDISIDTATNKMIVKDHGRGIPFRKNSSGKYAIVEVMTDTHSGGKFEGAEGYKSALGMHGLGMKIINALSVYCSVQSVRDDGTCSITFTNGVSDGPKITDGKNKDTGTTIEFIPDSSIFNGLKWNLDTIKTRIQTDALLNNGIAFVLTVDGKQIAKYLYSDGVKGLFEIKTADKKLITSPFFFSTTVSNDSGETAKVDLGFAYCEGSGETIYSYINGGETTGGTHVTGFRTGYTKLINKIAATDYNNDKGYTGDLIRRGLVLILIVKAQFRLAFAEQTKLTLNSPAAKGLVMRAVGQIEFNKTQSKEIFDHLEVERKADEAAQRKREAQENILHGGKSLNSLRDMPEKLADATDFNSAEIFFCEGDSAAGGAKETKNTNMAIMPLRGKILNTCNVELADCVKSQIIKDILTCLGCGIGDNFNINNLRYDRIIIMADSDPDGMHITLLLLTLFLYHLPQLLTAGKVYTAVSPIYKVKNGKNTLYLYDEKSAQKYFASHSGYTTTHIKGLGELNPDELYDTTMNPNTRKLVQMNVSNVKDTIALYNVIMGDNPSLRREFIEKNSLISLQDNMGDVYNDDDAE
jgi:DNA gyrase/topoisomerase IV subunit B